MSMSQPEPAGKGDWRVIRFEPSQPRDVSLAAWYLLAFGLVLFLPSQLRFDTPLWLVTSERQVQAWTWASASLMVFLIVGVLGARPNGLRTSSAVAIALVAAGIAWTYIAFTQSQASRSIAVISATLIGLLAILPCFIRTLPLGNAGLTAAVFVLLGFGARSRTPLPAVSTAVEARTVSTAVYPVSLTYQRGLVDSNETQGGAIEALGRGFLLVTGEGEFYQLDWNAEGRLESRRLALAAPLERAAFRADSESIRSKTGLRVTDIALDTAHHQLYAAHQHWNASERCLTMRVSRVPLTGLDSRTTAWETLFETKPCLSLKPALDDLQTGGELAWDSDGRLLLITGDDGFNGLSEPALAQQMDNDYGKLLRLDLAGGREIVSIGHRSPQGLLLDRDGVLWDTEHGPQGGDEINVLRPGDNYGWPRATYGTQYGVAYWPLSKASRNHGDFVEPVYAFVPSVAIASLKQLGDRQFPDWGGDFLAGSLRGMTLFRIRTRGGHVTFLESIPVSRRVRDLVEAADGRVILWTDEGELVTVAVAAGRPEGRVVYDRCASCHGSNLEGSAMGPPLRGVFGNRVAARAGYAYSPALRNFGGLWTRPRLNDFLANPAQVIPGTTMRYDGVRDRAERLALIEYLRQSR
jgi:cytochrome c2